MVGRAIRGLGALDRIDATTDHLSRPAPRRQFTRDVEPDRRLARSCDRGDGVVGRVHRHPVHRGVAVLKARAVAEQVVHHDVVQGEVVRDLDRERPLQLVAGADRTRRLAIGHPLADGLLDRDRLVGEGVRGRAGGDGDLSAAAVVRIDRHPAGSGTGVIFGRVERALVGRQHGVATPVEERYVVVEDERRVDTTRAGDSAEIA